MPVTIIAEAGVNHNGDLETAKRMAYAAKECGADIVKYQTAVPELVVSRFAEKAEYQKQTTDAAESQLEMIRKLHFSFEGHRELKEYCDSIGIQYLSAPFRSRRSRNPSADRRTPSSRRCASTPRSCGASCTPRRCFLPACAT